MTASEPDAIDWSIWLQTAQPGDSFVYHEGYSINLDDHHFPIRREIRDIAWQAHEKGQVVLVQERIRNSSRFRYIAIRISGLTAKRLESFDFRIRDEPF